MRSSSPSSVFIKAMAKSSEKAGFHESFDRREVIKGSSDRAFGLTVGGILLAIAAYRLYPDVAVDPASTVLLTIGGPLVLLGLLRPRLLAPLNRAWLKLGLLLSRIANPVVMALIFYVTVMPIGLVLRALGKDPLNRRWAPQASSYWVERAPPGPQPETMTQQF